MGWTAARRAALALALAASAGCSSGEDGDGGPSGAGGATDAGGSIASGGLGGGGTIASGGMGGGGGSQAPRGGDMAPETGGDSAAGGTGGTSAGAQCPQRVDDARACWDGHRDTCHICYAPDAPRLPCVGVGGGPVPTAVAPTRQPCATDSDCLLVDEVCDPGHALADVTGCRAPLCTDDAECFEGTVCDPDSEGAALAAGLLLDGCRLRRCVLGCSVLLCDAPGGPDCGQGVCEPSAADASPYSGCRALRCAEGEACPEHFGCSDQGTCLAIPCREPNGSVCEAGKRCDTAATVGNGCVAVNCNLPGGFACGDGMRCNPAARAGTGCTPVRCDEPAAPACPGDSVCNRGVLANGGCVRCNDNADCGCGYCVDGACFNEPGYCEFGCA